MERRWRPTGLRFRRITTRDTGARWKFCGSTRAVPNPKFNDLIERLRERMASVSILAPSAVRMQHQPAFYEAAAAIAS